MRRIAQALIILISVTGAAIAQEAASIQHAAATVAHLHDEMLNPASFALDGVFVTKPDRRGNVSVCYEYRSQNASGVMAAGRAVESGADHGKLSIYQAARADDIQGYNAGWVSPCKAKNFDREITQDVAAAAPALYTKSR
jgi:hypothetical protein